MGVTIRGIRETRSQDLLVDVTCATRDRGWLDPAFRDVDRGTGSICHLVPIVGSQEPSSELKVHGEK